MLLPKPGVSTTERVMVVPSGSLKSSSQCYMLSFQWHQYLILTNAFSANIHCCLELAIIIPRIHFAITECVDKSGFSSAAMAANHQAKTKSLFDNLFATHLIWGSLKKGISMLVSFW